MKPPNSITEKNSAGIREMIVFAGPSGSGKTTCLASFLAKQIFKTNKTYCLINLNNYTTGGGYRLKAYAEIFECPFFEKVTDDFTRRLIAKSVNGRDLMIDTGDITNDHDRAIQTIMEIRREIGNLAIRTFIVFNILHIYLADIGFLKRYFHLAPFDIILTHCDEAGIISKENTFLRQLLLRWESHVPDNRLIMANVGNRVPDDLSEYAALKEKIF